MSTAIDLSEPARAHAVAIPALPELREAAILTWAGRMKNEHGSARVFDALSAQLERAGLPGADACREFASEERRHGVLCASVVLALGGVAAFEEEPCDFPDHADASPIAGALRNVLAIGCLAETVAVSLIGAERLAMPEGPLRELLEGILADEIGHARFGWKLLVETVPSLAPDDLAALARYLPVAFAHLEAHELAHIDGGEGLGGSSSALGLCDGRDQRALFYATVSDVIVPRLDALGLDATTAWARRAEVSRAA